MKRHVACQSYLQPIRGKNKTVLANDSRSEPIHSLSFHSGDGITPHGLSHFHTTLVEHSVEHEIS